MASRLLPRGDWEKVTSGESQTDVYRRGATYAKVCAAGGVSDLADERDRFTWLTETGIPTARVLDWLESSEGAALLTAEVPGVPGSELSSSAELMRSLADALRLFHELPAYDCPFERNVHDVLDRVREVVRRGAVNYAFIDPGLRHRSPENLLSRLEELVPQTKDLVVCHGDATLANLFFDPETLVFTGAIDVGHLGVADRYSDLALASSQVVSHSWSTDSGLFLRLYGLESVDHQRLEFYALLDAMSWG